MSMSERIKTSVFMKIILIFLGAHIIIGVAGFTVHRYFAVKHHQDSIIKNMVHYSRFLAEEIGLPADTARARQLSDDYHIQIKLKDATVHWQSESLLPGFFMTDSSKQIKSGLTGDHFYVEIVHSAGHYLFIYDTNTNKEAATAQWRLLLMIATMMVILTILYFVIRFLLRPLKLLDKAVVELSRGNMDHRISINRRDEFGDLIRSFNQMASRLKQMLKMRDQLLLDVSHEMRSPLTRIKVALEFLEDGPARETIREDLTEIELMTAELLESERLDSRYGGLHLQTINFTDFMRQSISVYNSDKQRIVFNTTATEVLFRADPERLQTAFSNLFQNALKYSNTDQKPATVTIAQNNSTIIVKIQDYGQGIPEQDIPFVFEPFYRVDKSRSKETGGYGLGLSLTKKIIEAHKGTIEMDSSINKGTLFTIKF